MPSVEAAVDRLRRAADVLPLTHLLIGWRVPPRLLEACRKEADRLGIRFMRWHPLLSGGALHGAALDRRVVGPSGQRLHGFQGLPDFTFVCPNHPAVQEAIFDEVDTLVATGTYQGFFLDRVRFPSPAVDPLDGLACFCEHCRRNSEGMGVDLEAARLEIIRLGRQNEGFWSLVLALLSADPTAQESQTGRVLYDFLDFRCRSVTELCSKVAARIRAAGLEVGVDCFSPSLTRMVGQHLPALSRHADWIKIMTYAHTWGPAGLPFELASIRDFLIHASRSEATEVLKRMGDVLSCPLPDTRGALETSGLPPSALKREVELGIKQSRAPVLAGLELVEIPGVTRVNDAQIRADLKSIKAAHPDGLSISWDLQHIPIHRLELVKEAYLETP